VTFNPKLWSGTPELIAELWTLHKSDRRAVCSVWSHPRGVELRLEIEGRDTTTVVGADLPEVLDVAVRWNNELLAQAGWFERA
jgi:hypothetical protein